MASLISLAPEATAPTYAQSAAAAVAAVNAYRALATVGATATAALAPVTSVTALNDGAFLHSRYMVKNKTGVHDEVEGNTWWSAAGDQAGNNGNTFVSWPASAFNDQMPIDFWIAGAFHQMHMMDPMLQQVGYGAFTEATATADDIEAGATLDVLSGTKGPAGSKPIMFPGHNKVMTLRQFGGNEFPSPFTTTGCTAYVAPTGPHITLQIATVPNVTASSITRNGATVEHCRYDETNYVNPDPNIQSLGRIVLANSINGTATRHAIALLPRFPLTDGTYNVSVTSNGTTYAWTFFVGAAPVQRTLTVTKAGTGSGTVTGSGISCGADCTEDYANGTIVTLSAAPAGGSTFAGWGGACAGTGNCVVTMDAAKSVSATFNTTAVTQRTLTVTKTGTGTGTVSGTGISCGGDCTENYNDGTSVTLSAAPAAGSVFGGWSGACTGTASCTVLMNAAKTVTAAFNPAAVTQRTLTVTKAGTGTGTVTGTGISCGADCTENYNDGTSVTLTAAPTGGATFAGWSGACSGTGNCVVTMNAAKTVTATFTAAPTGSFAASAVVNPTFVAPGGTVGITATATTPPAGTYVVDIEVYDADGNQVFQWYWEDQPFAAGQTRTFSTNWQVPAGAAAGTYSVQVGIFSGPDWATEHIYNNNAAQVSVGSCSPRPRVTISSTRGAQGQIVVTATAGAGRLREIRFGAATNAWIAVPAGAGGRAGLANSPGNASLLLTDRPQSLTFSVIRAAGGQATTVPLTLVDDCGDWKTFVGGGPTAF
jgi:hypothetical protein